MRLIVLSASSVANDFLVGSLVADHPALVVREDQPGLGVVRRAWRRHRDPVPARLDKLAFFAFYALWLRRRVERGMRERLGSHPPVPAGPRVARIDDALAMVRDIRPDLVLVTGTSILSDAWQRLGVPIVNVHIGIAPRYRGRFCWFWPIVEGRPEDVGVTLHLVTGRVDAGPVVLQRRVPRETLGAWTFADVLTAVTLQALDLCRELLADPATCLRLAVASPTDKAARAAYLEPGLTAYLRYVRTTRGRSTAQG